MSRYFRFYTVEWKQHTSVNIFLESDRNSNGSNIEKEKRKGKELVILHNLKKEWTSKSCEKQKFSWVLGTDRTRNLNAARSLFSLTYCCFFALCQFFFSPTELGSPCGRKYDRSQFPSFTSQFHHRIGLPHMYYTLLLNKETNNPKKCRSSTVWCGCPSPECWTHRRRQSWSWVQWKEEQLSEERVAFSLRSQEVGGRSNSKYAPRHCLISVALKQIVPAVNSSTL